MANIAPQSTADAVHVQHRLTSTMIWVTFDKVGFHRYPDAPDEVAYLRDMHRHVFKFRVDITVTHDDREIEFHMFKNWLTSLYEGQLQVDYKSCEMLAQDLLNSILEKYNCTKRRVIVDVSEDGECGASLMSEPTLPFSVSKEWVKDTYLKLVADDDKELLSSAASRSLNKAVKKR